MAEVAQPPDDLARRGTGPRIHGRTDQDQAVDQGRIPNREVHRDLTSE